MKILSISEKILFQIEQEIVEQLTKRGIHCNYVRVYQVDNRNKFKVESSSFQTIPVLFKSISITQNWSTIEPIEEKPDHYTFSIKVVARFKYFELGENSVELFTISGKFDMEDWCVVTNIQ